MHDAFPSMWIKKRLGQVIHLEYGNRKTITGIPSVQSILSESLVGIIFISLPLTEIPILFYPCRN